MTNGIFAEALESIAARGFKKLGQLRATLHKAFAQDISRTSVYSAVRKAGIEVSRTDFMRYSKNLYEHWNKAVSEVRHWYDTGRFRISALPQQNIGSEGRFWSLTHYTVRTRRGQYETRYMVHSFDEISATDVVRQSAIEYIVEHYGIEEEDITDVQFIELYKNY